MESNTKLRPMYLFKLLYELTDENHPLTTTELVTLLDQRFDIKTQRTRIPQDVEALEQLGFEIGRIKGQSISYYFDQRLFELAELKLLIDAVESSSFITEKKSAELVQKLSTLTSVHKAPALSITTGLDGRLKQGNEQIYYIVGTLYAAILSGCKVSFQYFQYDIFKNRVLKHGGEKYVLSPYALTWNGEFYYVIGYLEKYQSISSLRVDRIANVPEILPGAARPLPEGFDLNEYKNSMFRMFSSERKEVELVCDESVMDAIIDRFGEDVDIGLVDEHTFSVTTEVAVNHVFYSWIFGFGGKVKLTAPKEAMEEYADMILSAAKTLHDDL